MSSSPHSPYASSMQVSGPNGGVLPSSSAPAPFVPPGGGQDELTAAFTHPDYNFTDNDQIDTPYGAYTFLAADRRFDEQHAVIKWIPKNDFRNNTDIDSFLRQAATVKRLTIMAATPRLAPFTRYGICNGDGWVAMPTRHRSLRDYAQHTLDAYTRDEPAPVEDVWQLVSDLTEALYVLHTQQPPIAHGRVEPKNVLVEVRDGRKRFTLMDVGFACETVPLGMGEFMLAGAEGDARLALRNDLYCLGVIAYRYAIGRANWKRAFTSVFANQETGAVTPADWKRWHGSKQQQPPPVSELRMQFDPRLSTLIAELMHKEDKPQYTSAEQLGNHLLSLGQPLILRNVAPAKKSELSSLKLGKKHLIAACLGISAMIGLFIFTDINSKPDVPDPRILAPQQFLGRQKAIEVHGEVRHVPPNASMFLWFPGPITQQLDMDKDGKFRGEAQLDSLGPLDAELHLVVDRRPILKQKIKVVREAPESNELVVRTSPPLAEAMVEVDVAGKVKRGVTDAGGVAEFTLPYGDIHVRVSKEYYRDYDRSIHAQIDPRIELEVPLEATHAECVVNVSPAFARVMYAVKESPTVRDIAVDDNGVGRVWLRMGDDHVFTAEADGYVPFTPITFVPTRGSTDKNTLTLSLRRREQLPTPTPGPAPRNDQWPPADITDPLIVAQFLEFNTQQAVAALKKIGPRAEPILLEVVDDRKQPAHVRQAAATALADNVATGQARETLLSAVANETDPQIATLLCKVWERIGVQDSDRLGFARLSLRTAREDKVLVGLDLLQRLPRDESFVSTISQDVLPLLDTPAKVRLRAIRALGRWGNNAAGDALMAALQAATDESVRTELIAALGNMGETRALPQIVASLGKEGEVAAAKDALILMGRGEQRTAVELSLRPVLRGSELIEQLVAVNILEQIGRSSDTIIQLRLLSRKELPGELRVAVERAMEAVQTRMRQR